MMASARKKNQLEVIKLFTKESSMAYTLLIAQLVFNSFRPDRLLPGGSIVLYFPTVILVILFGLWLIEPKKTISNTQTKLYVVFIIVMLLGMIFARNRSWALHQIWTHIIYIFLPYLVIVQFVDTNYKVEKYTRLFFILSLFLGLMGIAKKAMIPVPVLADENDFSLFMNLLIPIGFFLAQNEEKRWKKIFFYTAVGVFVFGTITSFSRGGFVGLISVGAFVFLKSKNKIATVVLVILIVSFAIAYAPSGYWEEMRTITAEGAEEGTGRERVETWKAGLKMFLDHPITGVGPLNFGMWLSDYYGSYSSKEPGVMWGRAAHSLYITLLSETGLSGLIVFVLMLWNNYKDHRYIANMENTKNNLLKHANLSNEENNIVSLGIRRLYNISLGYSGAMVAFLVTGIFLSVLWYGYFWMLMSFHVMTANAARNMCNILKERGRLNTNSLEAH